MKDKYDLSKFTFQTYDMIGNPVNVQYEVKYQEEEVVCHGFSDIPIDIYGVKLDVSYDGQEVYDFYNPKKPASVQINNQAVAPTLMVTFNSDDETDTDTDKRLIVGTLASEPMKVEVRECGTMKILKIFTISEGIYDFTIDNLAGLSVDDYSVEYRLLFTTLDDEFVCFAWEYLGIEKDAEKVESFVERMYEVTLGREADDAGMSTWKNGLLDGTFTGQDIANGFIMSDELQNKGLSNSEYVDVLYAAFFGRVADEAGKKTWVDLLDAGTSRKFVMAGFVNSEEFDVLCADYGIIRGTMDTTGEGPVTAGIRDFVLRIYEKVLEREGETQGIADWSNAIASGTFTAEDVAKLFFFSEEYVAKNATNEDFVETLYQTFMGRASDADGKAFWLEQLNGLMTREQVLEGFSQSVEFTEILKTFGL